MQKLLKSITANPALLALGFIVLLSYFTYVHNYHQPAALFWDENYHIASAQKYLHNVYFMEPHPPLGKMMIALGEGLLRVNETSDQFLGTDYGRKLTPGFSFAGYRFVPTVLAWLIAPMLFAIFWLLTKNYLIAVLLSFFYIFDNAVIVHSRSAMLESTLLFFVVAMVLLFLLLLQEKENTKHFRILSVLLGVAFAGVMTTKVNGLIMILLFPFLLWQLKPNWRQCGECLGLAVAGFCVLYLSVWHLHFALGDRIQSSLPDKGYYQASEQYKAILSQGKNGSLLHFPVMMRDSLAFLPHYQRGVPKLDLCKSDENGSPAFMWPIGARTINYRWETPDGSVYRYLYLVANPAGWFLGLAGVILAGSLLITSVVSPLKQPLKNPFYLTMFLSLYLGYMIAMSRITRVLYMYHYFIPLIFSFILFGLAFLEIRELLGRKITERLQMGALLFCAAAIFAGYQFIRPLTYYEPITDDAFTKRSILRMWDLKCVKCGRDSPLVRKTC